MVVFPHPFSPKIKVTGEENVMLYERGSRQGFTVSFNEKSNLHILGIGAETTHSLDRQLFNR